MLLTNLVKILDGLNLKEEAFQIKCLASEDWLANWKRCMTHYGFQSFGDGKWHKGRSYLEEPKDRVSAEHDISLVERAHSSNISDKLSDNFIKEFYGEKINIPPMGG